MDLQLTEKTAIVTGGSAGIGFACAKTLFGEGARVVIAANELVEEAAESIRQMASPERKDQVIPNS